MRPRLFALAAPLLLAALACGAGEVPAAPGPTRTPTSGDGLIVYADVKPTVAAVPARLGAPLPERVATVEAWPDSAPPPGQVRARLCAANPSTWDALFAAAGRAEAAGDAPAAVAAAWWDVVRWCGEPALCTLASERLPGLTGAARGVGLGVALAACPADAGRAWLADPAVPEEAVVDFVQEHGPGADTSWHPRMRASLLAAAGNPAAKADVRMLAMTVGSLDRADAASALVTAWGQAPEGWDKRGIAAAMYRQSDPRAREIFRAMCAADADPMCSRGPDAPLGYGADCAAVLAAPDPDASWTVNTCLVERAATDWAGARAAAEALPAALAAAPPLARTIAALRGPPDAQAARLRALGLLVGTPRAGVALLSPEDTLLAAGQLLAFDVETGQFPNEHDALLVELATLGGLGDVAFLEVPPAEGSDVPADAVKDGGTVVTDAVAPGGIYRLHAYADGKRWEVLAEDLGDWYDLDAVLALLNTVARDRGAPTRWIALTTGDQMATVVAGPEAGLRAAVAAKLLDAGGADGARATGKEAEENVLRRLLEE